ncbi:2,4-dihydroxyhept-2-enedioate aldolase [Tistlia consotensis]|uniref:2,4-dihydroxyhept-2-enedioate aldolase n=1 Tax=Tistlia consotensis USBA 355 TaxID=560819 RepID=A0A1Y6BK81_9PROT|nr:HpcH/HpaI aldolase/citrate lyase family protein [Tistlia consotensis]SMF12247.1 2,4-dihydroxyhept-2-enedioate aldolase [Tistlia consotensis USBA 355]SNR51224.1 2,4-dihydroxyhept-2-enedioate aldolase [Tistlia consotensis]
MAELRTNPFKQAIREGRPQIGLWSQLMHPLVADILKEAGFDWIVLDMEHGQNEIQDVLVQQMAMTGGTAEPVVRPPWNDMVYLKRILDTGAQTVLIPMIDDAEQAARAVSYCQYPPQGLRGVASGMRANRFGRIKGYHPLANEQICVLVQVESRKALENIDAIAAVAGVDGVFIGPTDLSTGLGHLADPNHPEVQAAIRHAVERCKAAGKPAGILTADNAAAERYLDWGYTFVAVGGDTGILANGADALAGKFLKLIGR